MIELFDFDYANMRLSSSLIRLDEEPIFIGTIDNGPRRGVYKLYIHMIKNEDNSVIFWPNDNINIEPVSLGFVNAKNGGCIYTERIPQRGWKIGLTTNNLNTIVTHNCGINRMIDKFDLLKSKSLRSTILGDYPPYDRAVGYVTKHLKGKAFSRNFGINSNGELIHSHLGVIGICRTQGPELYEKFFFFKEELEEVLNA